MNRPVGDVSSTVAEGDRRHRLTTCQVHVALRRCENSQWLIYRDADNDGDVPAAVVRPDGVGGVGHIDRRST